MGSGVVEDMAAVFVILPEAAELTAPRIRMVFAALATRVPRERAPARQKGGAAVEGIYRIDEQSRNGIGQHDSICGVRPQIGDTDGIGERFGGGNRLGAGGFHDR